MENKIKDYLDEIVNLGNCVYQEQLDEFEKNYNFKNGENSFSLMWEETTKVFQECLNKLDVIANKVSSEEEMEFHINSMMNEYTNLYGNNFHQMFGEYCMANLGGQGLSEEDLDY